MDAASTVDWRPYQGTAGALCVAVALNLWTGNGLWLAYSLTGVGVFGVLVGLVRADRLRPPTSTVWLAGIPVALHYIGGSMAGLHRVGGVNGMYAAFPWWDNVVHFLASFAVAAAVWTMLAPRVNGRGLTATLTTCVAVSLGVMVELYEFVQFVFFDTVDQGFYTNTLLDLYYNLLGAMAGVFAAYRAARPSIARGAEAPAENAASGSEP